MVLVWIRFVGQLLDQLGFVKSCYLIATLTGNTSKFLVVSSSRLRSSTDLYFPLSIIITLSRRRFFCFIIFLSLGIGHGTLSKYIQVRCCAHVSLPVYAHMCTTEVSWSLPLLTVLPVVRMWETEYPTLPTERFCSVINYKRRIICQCNNLHHLYVYSLIVYSESSIRICNTAFEIYSSVTKYFSSAR